MPKLVKPLYNLFEKSMGFLLIAPQPNQKINKLYYVKTLIGITGISGIFITAFYLRWTSLNSNVFGNSFLKYLNSATEALGIYAVLMSYSRYLKVKQWNNLFQRISAAPSGAEEEQVFLKKLALILVVFLGHILAVLYLILHATPQIQLIYAQMNSVWKTAVYLASPWIQLFYVIFISTYVVTLTLKLQRKLTTCQKHLQINRMKVARNGYHDVDVAAQLFRDLFGYQLLAVTAQWFVYLVELFFGFAMVMRQDGKIVRAKNQAGWEIVVWLGVNVLLTSFGPCALAFTCQTVTSEAENLLSTCYQLQENLDYRSYEFQELQSLGEFITSNRIRFTAAGFMEIKRDTLLTIVATSTTYFVALVQIY